MSILREGAVADISQGVLCSDHHQGLALLGYVLYSHVFARNPAKTNCLKLSKPSSVLCQ
jgi:hypothetical protein